MIKTLLVDDEKSFLDLSKTYLEKQNEDLEVKTTNSPKKALKKIKQNQYDCIVCDYQMPEFNGLEVLKKVRKELNNDIPFIMFTGKGREEVAIEALNNGTDRYLKKGGDPKTQFGVLADAIKQETRHYRYKKELRKQRTYYSELFKASPEAIVLTDKDGYIIDINESFEDLFGYKLEEIKGNYINKVVVPKEKKKEAKDITRKSLRGEVVKEESVRQRKNGTKFWSQIISCPIKTNGEVIGAYGVYRDLSDRKEKEEVIQEMLDGVPDVIGFQKPDHNIIRYNETGIELFNTNLEEIKNKKCYELLGRESECKKCSIREAIKSKKTVTIEKHQPEINKYVKSTAKPVLDEEGEVKYLIEHINDITEKKEAEEKREKLLKTFSSLKEIIFLLDKNHNILFTNKEARNFFEKSEEELKGAKCYKIIHETQKPIKDCPLEKLLEEKNSEEYVEYEYYDKMRDKHFLARIYPVNDKNKKFIHQIIDITDRKEKEKREDLLHSILRHDLINKLQVSLGYGQMLKEDGLTEKQKKMVGKDWKAKNEAIKLIKKIKKIRKAYEEELENKELKPVLESIVGKYQHEASSRGMEIKLEECNFKAKGGNLLDELFSNLIINSIKHSKGTKLVIKAKKRNSKIVVTIEDDGKGIPDELKQKVFERGYSVKEKKGSGLGLYFTKEIVNSYKGKIKIKDSELGGARFDIHLQKA